MRTKIVWIAYRGGMPAPTKLTKLPLGPTGEAVAANVKRLMETQNLTFVALADRLQKCGRPIPTLGLRKIVAETRRVDADDLAALAFALGVSPSTLLYLWAVRDDELVAVTAAGDMSSLRAWAWLIAELPPHADDDMMAFFARAWPTWVRRNVEILKAAHGDGQ